MSIYPEKPFYTSSEGMKFALQPEVTPIPKPILPPRPAQTRSFGKPDFQPLLKPSQMKFVSELSHGNMREPILKPSEVKFLSEMSRGRMQPPSRGNSYSERLRNQARVVSPAPKLSRPRFKVTLKSKQPSLGSVRNAPFANRTNSASVVSQLKVDQQYNSLLDPHLEEYFARKFLGYPAQSSGRRVKRPKPIEDTMYKVVVVTNEQKNAGTTANVFIRINGRSTKVPKYRLTKKSGLVKTSNGKRFQFLPGSEETFNIKGPSISIMKSVTIETDGLTKKEGFLIDYIEITNLRNKKKWDFSCGQWLSLYEGDCQISRELFPRLETEKHQPTDYEIVTVTGEKLNAGTNANVFITIYGNKISTPRLHLYDSDQKDPFERGQADSFILRTKDVGKIKKIRIEHDNTGMGSGWFLEEVSVTNRRSKETNRFLCNQWLAKDEGDGRICRDLIPTSRGGRSAGALSSYRIEVFTGTNRGAGTDANVFVTLFGKKGDSGDFQLRGSGNLFEKGEKNTFTEEIPDLGDLTRLRVHHDNTGVAPGWFLDKIVVTDSKGSHEFPCNRWLAKNEDDGKISRDLICSGKSILLPYDVQIMTGNVRNAGTDANVFIELHAGKNAEEAGGSSGKIWLEAEREKFERGDTDRFTVDVAGKLSPLSSITLGHDNTGIGPGWFVDKVIVHCATTGIEQHFPCGMWFATDEGDGVIERQIREDKSLRKKRDKLTPWDVFVHTSDLRGGGTDARVHMTLYGEKGKSDLMWLDNNSDKFERGQTDQFLVETLDVGKPYKLRIGHDDSNPASGWHLDSIEMINRLTKKKYGFPCSRWLATDEDDGEIIRELPAQGSDIKNPMQVVKYQVDVHTGNKFGAGTDADVFCCIYGTHGDTGDRFLNKSHTHKNKFEKNNTDTFVFEAVSLRELEKLKIGHNGRGAGAGWFLDKVVVKQMGSSKYDTVFPCGRWLASDEDDGQIVRELYPSDSGFGDQHHQNLLKSTSYRFAVKTGDVRNAGTDANVFVKVYGKKGDTGELRLYDSANNKDPFERGRIDLFTLEASDIGKVTKIKIGHDGKGMGAGWFLEDVELSIPSRGEVYKFPCHRWLASDESDGTLEVELFPADLQERTKSIPYEVVVTTGELRGAGTDANVFLQIYGEDGKTENFSLRNKTDNFERGATDLFKLEGEDVGRIRKIRVETDGKGMASGWFLDTVRIRKPISNKRKRKSRRRTMSETSARSKGKRPTSSRGSGRRSTASSRTFRKNNSSESDASSSDADSTDRNSDDIWPEGDRSSVRTKSQKRTYSYDDSESDSLPDWELRSERSGKSKGSTSRNGRKSSAKSSRRFSDLETALSSHSSKYKNLKKRLSKAGKALSNEIEQDRSYSDESLSEYSGKSRHKKKYQDLKRRLSRQEKRSNIQDETEIVSEESDSVFDRPSTSKSRMSDRSSTRERKHKRDATERQEDSEFETYYFVCRRWFARSEDDGALIRELIPTDENGKPLKDNDIEYISYEIHVFTGDVSGAGTDANVFLNLFGELGDSGERQLKDSATNRNKFERAQEDVFTVEAGDLGKLRKLKIWHDNSGIGAAWHLDRIEVIDPKDKERYVFPCEEWLSLKKGDGQICRELVPVSEHQMRKLSRTKSAGSMKDELGLEMSAQVTQYHVTVKTGTVRGAGTDANVYIILYGEEEDTGKVFLKHSKTNKNKFENGQSDEFTVDAVDLGLVKKILIGHDNKGGFADWFLDSVDIDCPSLGKKWHFPCGRWLATNKDDGALERELFPADTATEEYEACIPYEFSVHTSDIRGAGTDADVFVAVFGNDGASTRQVSLCSDKQQRKQKFNRGDTDKFIVQLEDVGNELSKLRIGHDGQGWGAGWHLDKVEVKKLLRNGSGHFLYTFPCGKWFAKDEDDGSIVRDLIPSSAIKEFTDKDGTSKQKEVNRRNSLKIKRYQIKIYTGDVSMAGTDANVFLRVYGRKGESGEKQLKDSETYMNKFERDHVDVFSWEVADLGELEKIDIRHDDSMFKSDWYLDRVDIIDMDDNKNFSFSCNRWLGKEKDDGKLCRTIYEKNYDPNSETSRSAGSGSHSRRSSGASEKTYVRRNRDQPYRSSNRGMDSEDLEERSFVPYTIKLTTGDSRGAGTDCPVWIRIFGLGKSLDTGRIPLEIRNKQPPEFLPGTTETFSVDGPDVGKIKGIQLGFDASSPKDSWLVKEIEVHQPTKGRACVFNVEEWFGKNGITKKKFYVDDSSNSTLTYKPLIPYQAFFYTGRKNHSGTDCDISVKLFGSEGTSSEVKIEHSSDRFDTGKTDKIPVELEDVGIPKKLRVKLLGDGKSRMKEGNRWYLEKVELCNTFTDKSFIFPCDTWLSTDSKSGIPAEIDLPSLTAKGKASLSAAAYVIKVKTSDIRNAGTDANVCCTLYGEHGDSGELFLKQSETHWDKFERNHTDIFRFPNMLNLGRLTKIRIWHDNKGFGAAWHLDWVEVAEETSGETYLFPCGRWLSLSEDDKQLCRELTCTPSNATEDIQNRENDEYSFEIAVTTGDKREAETLHHAWIVLHGKKDSSKQFWIENSSRKKIFRRGQVDSFKFKSKKQLGTLKALTLGHFPRDGVPVNPHPDSERENSWFCQEISVTELSSGRRYAFPCKEWIRLSAKARDAAELSCASFEEDQVAKSRDLPLIQYEVTVVTADERGAGTDANVTVTLVGEGGDSGPRSLKQRFRNLFERGQTDVFNIEAVDMGKLRKLVVEHDSSGFGAGWLLDTVEVRNCVTGEITLFPCGKWLDREEGDGTTKRELLPKRTSRE